MSENKTVPETVEIPGELRLSNPVPPPITVRLPLVVWSHGRKNALVGLILLPTGLFCLLMAAAIVLALVTELGAPDLSLRGGFVFLILLATLPFAILWGAGFTGAALTCFWDAARSNPVLEITADGLRDRRSGLSVRWSSIKCAKFFGYYGIDLELRGPVRNWQNPFRVGVLFQRYRPKPNHVIVSVGYLDTRTHVLAYTILTLTQWNGGEAISATSGSFDMGLKVLPRRTG